MATTTVTGEQIKDNTVGRDDLIIATAGKAVVRKLVAGTNISLTSTGADAGTGDVTIDATGGGGASGATIGARIAMRF